VDFQDRDLANELTPVVRRIFADDRAKLLDIRIRAIAGGGGQGTTGVFKVHAIAKIGDQNRECSLVAKLINLKDGGDADGDASGLREVRAYTSGMLDALPPSVRAPRCHGITAIDDDTSCLWLEDVSAYRVDVWTMEGFELAARSLGMFNGRFYGRTASPDESWWSRNWLEKYLAQTDAVLADLPQIMRFPLVRRWLPPESLETVELLWSRRSQLLERLNQAPAVFSHLDANCRNLFFVPSVHDVPVLCLIDWATAGAAPLGAELSALVLGSVLLYGAKPSDLPELQARALRGYVDGLRASGWNGRESDIFECYATFSLLRYTAYQLVRVHLLCDQRTIAWAERAIGHPVESVIDRFEEIRNFLRTTFLNHLPG
jgi:hypothetical protein